MYVYLYGFFRMPIEKRKIFKKKYRLLFVWGFVQTLYLSQICNAFRRLSIKNGKFSLELISMRIFRINTFRGSTTRSGMLVKSGYFKILTMLSELKITLLALTSRGTRQALLSTSRLKNIEKLVSML